MNHIYNFFSYYFITKEPLKTPTIKKNEEEQSFEIDKEQSSEIDEEQSSELIIPDISTHKGISNFYFNIENYNAQKLSQSTDTFSLVKDIAKIGLIFFLLTDKYKERNLIKLSKTVYEDIKISLDNVIKHNKFACNFDDSNVRYSFEWELDINVYENLPIPSIQELNLNLSEKDRKLYLDLKDTFINMMNCGKIFREKYYKQFIQTDEINDIEFIKDLLDLYHNILYTFITMFEFKYNLSWTNRKQYIKCLSKCSNTSSINLKVNYKNSVTYMY